MDNQNSEFLQYIKMQNQSRLLTAMIIKIILSAIAVFIEIKGLDPSLDNILIGFLLFAFVYDLCYLYQFSLNLTGNYFVAIIVSAILLGAVFYVYDNTLMKLNFMQQTLSLNGERIFCIVVTLIFLIPLFLNIRSLIKTKTR